jgi:predicted adenylyl cyclase CyaB
LAGFRRCQAASRRSKSARVSLRRAAEINLAGACVMRNLEAKFRVDDAAQARRRAEAVGFSMRATLDQRDTFFRVAHGKLKLREEAAGAALIHYGRSSDGALEVSDYEIVPVANPGPLRTMLGAALGVLAEVRKQRTLLLRRNVRLHLDRVEGLGSFGEIEAVVAADEAPELYRIEVGALLASLNVDINNLIIKSYFELINGG